MFFEIDKLQFFNKTERENNQNQECKKGTATGLTNNIMLILWII